MTEEGLSALSEADVVEFFERYSNRGRWGDEDEIGTLNFITPKKRIAAAALVRSGTVLSLGKT